MELRTITQMKVYLLCLNPIIREVEANKVVAWSYSREALIGYYNALKTAPYKDIGPNLYGEGMKEYTKFFLKGSPLEDYNPITNFDTLNEYGQGMGFNWSEQSEIDDIPKDIIHVQS